jgi:hypothetical protein
LRVKALQESGQTLEEIRQSLLRPDASAARAADPEPAVLRNIWRRLTLAPGVELHLAADVRVPSAARLAELGAWCRTNLAGRVPSARSAKHDSPFTDYPDNDDPYREEEE